MLFCDLVGFTSRAESMDPEDVEALLRPYHERVRSELERHGGTVEKFIGDAVMALFGAPTAHEDDPERAVRAALAIREFALEEGLELRVGITTGEALVSLDARPDAGEGMASGDVVNTAARLQSAAPVNGVIVDETTYRATRSAIDYEEADPVEAKGKSEPIAVWEAVRARSRFGVDVAHEARSELVGRERELGIVQDAFERARHERTPQLLTLVGVPGIGKSRIVYELSRIVDADPEIITWRQGRCLAYGDGITMWALGEIVKAQAGVLEQDSPEEIAHKIRQVVEDTLAGTGEEARVEAHLLALLGLAEEAQLGGDRRKEAFAAWRRFLEGLAEQRTLVVVVEDIHWADESLLDFLDELVDWVTDVPLLVVATARPELLERRPGWGGGKLNATTLALAPLSDEQTARLLGHLLGKPLLEAESQKDAPRARRRKPALRGAVRRALRRAGLERSAPASRDPPGHHRRTPRRPPGVGEGSPAGCRSRREGLLGKLDRPRLGGGQRIPSLTGAQGLRAPPAALVTRGGERVRLRARARARRRLRTDRPRRPRGEAPRDCRVDREPRSAGGPRGDARLPLELGTRARPCFG